VAGLSSMATKPLLGILLTALVCAGCAVTPEPLRGDFAAVHPNDPAVATGQVVRWGGVIKSVKPGEGQTCVEVIGHALDRGARPVADGYSGRFIACKPGFLDPEVYRPGREVTVTGVVEGYTQDRVGDFEYVYPRVAVQAEHLWPLRNVVRDVVYVHPYPLVRGAFFFGPYGYYDPFFHGPHFHHPPRVIRAPAPPPSDPSPPEESSPAPPARTPGQPRDGEPRRRHLPR
jgi:outer membrane lipoprotein